MRSGRESMRAGAAPFETSDTPELPSTATVCRSEESVASFGSSATTFELIPAMPATLALA